MPADPGSSATDVRIGNRAILARGFPSGARVAEMAPRTRAAREIAVFAEEIESRLGRF